MKSVKTPPPLRGKPAGRTGAHPPATYRVELHSNASKALATLPKKIQRQIARRIDGLAENPSPEGSKPLKGKHAGLRRIRSGDYRIVYAVLSVLTVIDGAAVTIIDGVGLCPRPRGL